METRVTVDVLDGDKLAAKLRFEQKTKTSAATDIEIRSGDVRIKPDGYLDLRWLRFVEKAERGL